MKKSLIIFNLLFVSANVLAMNPVDGSEDNNRRSLTSVSEDNSRISQEAEERLTKYEEARDIRIQREFSELMQAIKNRDLKKVEKIAFKRSSVNVVRDFVLDFKNNHKITNERFIQYTSYFCYNTKLFRMINKNGFTPLIQAIAEDNIDITKCLVEYGVDVNTKDNIGRTPLIHASRRENIDIVKYLVEYGANINQADKIKNTPLIYASYKGNIDIVKYLVKHSANVNQVGAFKRTPLMNASVRGNFNLVKYLVDHGADVNSADICGKTPSTYASPPNNIDIVEYLVKHGANVNKADALGRTPLMIASEKGNIDIAQYPVEHKAKRMKME